VAHLFLALALIIFLIRFLKLLIFITARRNEGIASSAGIINIVIKITIWVVGGLVLLDTLGLSITPFLASLGIGSLALGLALQDTLSNFFSGFYLTLERSFKIGDFIKFQDGNEGIVDKTTWRATYLKTLQGNHIIIPNAKMASSAFTNFDFVDKAMTVTIPLVISPQADVARIEKITLEVAREVINQTPGAIKGFEPLFRFSQILEATITCNVVLRCCQYNDQFLLIHQFIKKFYERLAQEGIEAPAPRRIVQVEAISPQVLDKFNKGSV
jgi:small-conductance mechanosensitive channel